MKDEQRSDSTNLEVPPRKGTVRAAELVIPSYNRIDRLEQTLLAIRRLYPCLPIRVALQGEDHRSRLKSLLEADNHFVIEYAEQPGLIAALNRAVSNSPAEICILLDDDAVPCDGWLEAHLDAFNDPVVAYTFGREVNAVFWRSRSSELARMIMETVAGLFISRDKKLNGRIVGWINRTGFVYSNFFLPGECTINAPAEGNFAIRRDIFVQNSGYSTEFRGNCWGYGPELGVRLARQGQFGRYVGGAIMVHRPHPQGGTRARRGRDWYRDFVHNNFVLARSVGRGAWIGAMPRLIRRMRG